MKPERPIIPLPATCKKCRFYVEASEEEGECRRRAPFPSNAPMIQHNYCSWPRVRPTWFCGEFTEK